MDVGERVVDDVVDVVPHYSPLGQPQHYNHKEHDIRTDQLMMWDTYLYHLSQVEIELLLN